MLSSNSEPELENESPSPHEYSLHVHEQMGIDLLERGIVKTSKSAATMVDTVPSTLRHRRLGQRIREEAGQSRQKFTPAEERFLVEHCEHLRRCGFPVTVEHVREHALHVYQQWVPEGRLGKDWVKNSLYHRHPEVKSKFSKQLDYKR